MIGATRAGVALVIAIGLMGDCRTAPARQEDRNELIRRASAALADWNTDTPGIERFARQGHG